MTEKIKEQILAIRDSGVCNMLLITQVQYEADKHGFYELVIYLIDHRAEYSRFILIGEAEND